MSSLPLHHPLEALRAHRISATRKPAATEPGLDARTAAARRIRERDRDRAATSVPPPRPLP